jgi:hypothetical protein
MDMQMFDFACLPSYLVTIVNPVFVFTGKDPFWVELTACK